MDYQSYSYQKEGFTVHMLTSSARTFFTNAYLIETVNGLVAVDTMMINADAKALRQLIDKIAKPLLGVIITHGHPDHYNGTDIVTQGVNAIPVISTLGVVESIKNRTDAKELKWKAFFAEEWPDKKVLPNRLVANSEVITLDEIDYRFRDLGKAESSSDLYVTVGRHASVVFVGDVVFHKMHGFMNDGHSLAWLKVLKELLVELAAVPQLFTGHGEPSNSADAISAQIEYIQYYRDTLTGMQGGADRLSVAQKNEFEQKLVARYPDYSLKVFILAGVDSVSLELASSRS